MRKKNKTKNLLQSLHESDNLQNYWKNHSSEMIDKPLHCYLLDMLRKKKMTKSQVIKNADLNDIYGYQIFSGFRYPSRNKLICLCVGMLCNVDECNELLKYGGFAELYPRNKRDSIIIWGIDRKLTIDKINELLFDNNEKTLN